MGMAMFPHCPRNKLVSSAPSSLFSCSPSFLSFLPIFQSISPARGAMGRCEPANQSRRKQRCEQGKERAKKQVSHYLSESASVCWGVPACCSHGG